MRKLNFFPTPYPDECYYSIFCRYFARSGSTSNKRTIFELFGEAQSLASFVFLPRRLELVETWVGIDHTITRENLASRNSCYAYFSIAFTESMFQGMEQKIKTGKTGRSLERQIIQKCRHSHWPEYLRYCPDCTLEDIEKYGETYWHRMPQLPGIEYCPKHKKPIHNSNVQLRQTTMAFLPASHALRKMEQCEDLEERRYRQKYLRIAKDTEWLLKNGLKLKGCREIARKYKELFMEKGLTTVQGIRYCDRIEKAFIKYHGQAFINQLFSDDDQALYWLQFVFVSQSEHLRPLHHVLLMEFLKESAEAFFQAVPDNKPYGNGPWPCINKLCQRYGKDGAEKISITYLNGQPVGHFQCTDCGMKYQRSRPEQSFEEYAQHAVKLEYGHLWYKALRNCIEVEKMCPADVARTMKSAQKTVSKRAEEIGLDVEVNCTTRKFRSKGRIVNADVYYHEKVLEILTVRPELTVKELNELAPGAYAWFYKNDFQWLKERLVMDQEKQCWSDWEKEQLSLLQSAYESIKKTGDPDRRITIGWLCTIADSRECDIKGRLHRFPDIRNFISNVTESKTEWLTRRFAGIAERKRLEGEQLTLADIKREMRLKPNTYKKYAVFMESIIEQLNN